MQGSHLNVVFSTKELFLHVWQFVKLVQVRQLSIISLQRVQVEELSMPKVEAQVRQKLQFEQVRQELIDLLHK
jgi:hypothetical protein